MSTLLEMLKCAGLIFFALNLALVGSMVTVRFLTWFWHRIGLSEVNR